MDFSGKSREIVHDFHAVDTKLFDIVLGWAMAKYSRSLASHVRKVTELP